MQRDPLAFLLEMSERFDKIAYFRAGKLPVYVIHHPDGIKHVLQEQPRRYSKDTIQYRALATITGKGLLTVRQVVGGIERCECRRECVEANQGGAVE